MKKNKWLLVGSVILAVCLIIVGLVFVFSSVSNDSNKDSEKNTETKKSNSSSVEAVILDGKYNDADLVCMVETRTAETVKFYDVVYIFLKDKSVKKTNLVNLMVCSNKDIFDEQKANDDKAFERYYDENTLAISYEYEDEQIYITDNGDVHVDKSGNDLKSELEVQGYVCE